MAKKSADKNKSCPFCDETIKISAIKCKHCQSALVPLSQNAKNSSNRDAAIHIHNTISNPPAVKSKPTSYIVNPVPYVNDSKTGHGISSILLSFVLFAVYIDELENTSLPEDDLIATILTGEVMLSFVAVYALWIIFQDQSNKILPAISLAITSLFMVSFLGYWP